jgi:hypothetical protein
VARVGGCGDGAELDVARISRIALARPLKKVNAETGRASWATSHETGGEMADERRRLRRGSAGGQGRGKGLTIPVTTDDRPGFDQPLVAYHFDAVGNLRERAVVEGQRLTLEADPADVRGRLFIAPRSVESEGFEPSPSMLERIGAYEAILRPGDKLIDVIRVPGDYLDLWPLCFCTVKGRVLRSSDGRPICNARVHICEVDRIPIWILQLPELDLVRLRDDLLSELRKPLIPTLERRLPFPPRPGPGPDPAPDLRRLFRAPAHEQETGSTAPAARLADAPLSLDRRLFSSSTTVLRAALAENWKLILPYFCYWPWWWGWFRCDEVAVLTTDPNGRFQTTIAYVCGGDKPDLYFWVEYDFGSGFETVYEPPIACWTYWDYTCGSEVTIHVSDQRVPGCNDEPDLPGRQVWVLSIGRDVSIGEIYTSGTVEGLVSEPWDSVSSADYAFGGKLEPRVWFSRDSLIGSGITHYLWSRRKVGEMGWTPLSRQVIRHYTDIASGTMPIDVMGPESGGANAGRFRIRPTAVPSADPNDEWVVADEREDLATAHFETFPPPLPADRPDCGVSDPNAGRYELKLELFDTAGNLVDLDAAGVTLRYATTEAPFGTATVNTVIADAYHRIFAAGNTVGFRMVVHVDNGYCGGDIEPISGSGLTVDANCGIVTMTGPNPTVDVAFSAGRPGGLARFRLSTHLGVSSTVNIASTGGSVDDASTPADPSQPGNPGGGTFVGSAPCGFSRTGIAATDMLHGCPQGAFAEWLYVWALTQDGYNRLSGLDASDVSAFMLTTPCPPCEDDHGHGPPA